MGGAVLSCAYLIDVLENSAVESITLQSFVLSYTVSLALRIPVAPYCKSILACKGQTRYWMGHGEWFNHAANHYTREH